ncbi:MAG: Na-translocating system protein MpsC family protein [Solirubrobacterales bacterium]
MGDAHGSEAVSAGGGSIVAEIAREVVRIHARYYGRGPTKAKAIWRNGVVVVILEEIFTKAEEVLVEAGHFAQVRSHRQVFQDQVESLFREAIERVTGRTVRSFLSQVTAEGVAAEVFVLAEE